MEHEKKQEMRHEQVRKMVQAAVFLALGQLLPFVTGQVPQIGSMLLPMHIPVILCGMICGGGYGLLVGIICPLLRSVLFGMPALFPTAVAMAFELGTYGFVSGFLYSRSRWQCIAAVEKCLIAAMAAGRVVWGIAMTVLMAAAGGVFTFQLFLAGAFLNAIPGIILQLIFIPAFMLALHKAGLVPFHHRNKNLNNLERETASHPHSY
ncbi:MAG: ECF transporter S component [Eubacterium sp.]|nr:ECF transporter S component [Eubacterium sp.]